MQILLLGDCAVGVTHGYAIGEDAVHAAAVKVGPTPPGVGPVSSS